MPVRHPRPLLRGPRYPDSAAALQHAIRTRSVSRMQAFRSEATAREGLLNSNGKPPPPAVRLARALPSRRAVWRQCGLHSKNNQVRKGGHDARIAPPVARTKVLQISSGIRPEIPEAGDFWRATAVGIDGSRPCGGTFGLKKQRSGGKSNYRWRAFRPFLAAEAPLRGLHQTTRSAGGS